MLARIIEASGMATILVTNMPFWAEKLGVPRTLAVEFPFGHILGQPHNVDQQMAVIQAALEVLENAQAPGEIVHASFAWPEPQKAAYKAWQPEEPSPVVEVMAPRVLKILRKRKKDAGR